MKYREPTTYNFAESREIAKQIEVELALLVNLEHALRVALDWATEQHGNKRKLSTLRFVAWTFERHLTRMRVLAEYGGYMHLVSDTKPHLAGHVKALMELRNRLQTDLERIIVDLDHVSPDDAIVFDRLCVQLRDYFEGLEIHRQQEMELLQHSFVQEEGTAG